jgi:cytoskeletal protein RodZ
MVRDMRVGTSYHIRGQECAIGENVFIHEPDVRSGNFFGRHYKLLTVLIVFMLMSGTALGYFVMNGQRGNKDQMQLTSNTPSKKDKVEDSNTTAEAVYEESEADDLEASQSGEMYSDGNGSTNTTPTANTARATNPTPSPSPTPPPPPPADSPADNGDGTDPSGEEQDPDDQAVVTPPPPPPPPPPAPPSPPVVDGEA